jgi:hypothetical protein
MIQTNYKKKTKKKNEKGSSRIDQGNIRIQKSSPKATPPRREQCTSVIVT